MRVTDDQERLSDPADVATRNEEMARVGAVAASRRPAGPQYTGVCHYCDDPVDAPRRWCNAFCRDFWERDQ